MRGWLLAGPLSFSGAASAAAPARPGRGLGPIVHGVRRFPRGDAGAHAAFRLCRTCYAGPAGIRDDETP